MLNAATLMGLLTAIVGLGACYVRSKFVGHDRTITRSKPHVAAQRRLYFVFVALAVLGLLACAAILIAFNVLGADRVYAAWAAAGTGALLLVCAVLAVVTYGAIPK